MARESFDHVQIEKAAQEKWASLRLSETDLEGKDPYYLLVEFPYPSGDLHIGHWYAFALTDIYARYMRMKGKNVLFPIGFDAFGLPAENAAIRNNEDPKKWTYANIDRMRTQIKSMGTTFDWSKEVLTCEPSYYKWTQWLFTKLYEHNLAYRAEAPVKWCPKDQTVLANEQVIDGACERCGTQVEEKRLTQWFMKITEYAKRLLSDLEPLPWREDIKEAQRAWIGESKGAKLSFELRAASLEKDSKLKAKSSQLTAVQVFTTRPDTVYGAAYLVLAPEHPLISSFQQGFEQGLTLLNNDGPPRSIIENGKEVRAYVEATKRKTERERSENKDKTGIKIEGVVAINPATKEEIPVYIADYVLASYGTGAVMAVPAHDERDFEFATKYGLPMREVVIEQVGKRHAEGVYRRIVIAIIENKKGEVLIQSQDKGKGKVFCWPGGGVDEGEHPEIAAIREATEETGYVNFTDVKELGTVEANYFNPIREVNRRALSTGYVMCLKNDEQQPPEFTEREKKSVIEHAWVSKKEAMRLLTTHGIPSSDDLTFFQRFLDNNYGPYTGSGVLINSGEFTERESQEVTNDIIKAVGGEHATSYHIRDWLISRQRYWGCPIPIVYDPEGNPHAISEEHLPWLLPTDVDFLPKADPPSEGALHKAPLASSDELKVRVEKIFGRGWTPEYDTFDTFVDSSWYYLRYLAPNDDAKFSDASLMQKWLPVNRYSGGSEHTTMHLLYARFFHKALYDLSLVPTPEPFHERFNRGLILGPDGQKMSKSRGNVVNPDEFVEKYGSDAVRMYLAFIGPYNESGSYPWHLEGVASMHRFLDRIYALKERIGEVQTSPALLNEYTKAITKVGGDIERFKLNTAIAALMILVREMEKEEHISTELFSGFVLLLAPFAPHLAEHLHELHGGEGSIHKGIWPVPPKIAAKEAKVNVVVQVDGRRRGAVMLPKGASEAQVLQKAIQIEAVRKALKGVRPERVVYVPGRILSLVSKK